MTKNIFISYCSKDIVFMEQFLNSVNFREQIGSGTEIFNYTEHSNYGAIQPMLDDKITESSAMVMLISRNYIQSRYSLFEFWMGLKQQAERKLIFVPVMIDAAAEEWWQTQKRENSLQDLIPAGGSYSYVKFIDSTGGGAVSLVTPQGVPTSHAQRVVELAILIQKALDTVATTAAADSTAADPAAADPAAADSAAADPAAPNSQIVVLGHSDGALPPHVQESAVALARALQAQGKAPAVWGDGWAGNDAARPDAQRLLAAGTIFVQPLSIWDAQFVAIKPETPRESLAGIAGKPKDRAGELTSDIVLWLPSDLSEPSFEVAQTVPPTRISRKAPSDLALELLTQSGQLPPTLPIIVLEEEFTDDPGLRDALHQGFLRVVSDVIKPAPEGWGFDSAATCPLLEQQINIIEGDKAIIVLHDLDLESTKDPIKLRKSIETKFTSNEDRVRKAEGRVRDVEKQAGRERPPLKLFFSTIVFEHSDRLPFVLYPAPRLAPWHLLRFVSQEKTRAIPDPSCATIFQSYLRGWAR